MKDFKFVIALLITCTSCISSQAQLYEFMSKWKRNAVLEHAQVGVAIHDAATAQRIDGYNEVISLIPASSLKLLTTLTAYNELGKDFTYHTTLAYDGKIDADGTLQGNLYVIGAGDPTLGSGRITGQANWSQMLKSIVQSVQKVGITCIDGKITADESIFDSYPIAPSWQWNDLGNYYAGGAWGININENEYNVFYNSNFSVGSPAKLLYTDPKVDGLVLQNEVTIDSANTGDNAYIFGGPYDFTKRIVGTIPQSKETFKIKGAIPNPPLFLALQLKRLLDRANIFSDDILIKIKPSSKDKVRSVFDTLTSPPLTEIIRQANYYSINQYCESLLKTMASLKYNQGSGAMGVKIVQDQLQAYGVDVKALHMEDGSGLSARNLVSPDVLSHFLASFARENGIDILQDLLPKAGSQGTVKGVQAGYGHVWMKSGSMNRIQSFTGICKAKSGKWITFSFITNGYFGKYKDIKPLAESLINYIYKSY